MICPATDCNGEFKLIDYKQAQNARTSFGIFQCSKCGYREVIK